MKEFSKDGYIVCIGDGQGGTEISDERYHAIISAFNSKPQSTETTDYKLRVDLTWEAYAIPEPQPEPEPDIDDSEAISILLGEVEE